MEVAELADTHAPMELEAPAGPCSFPGGKAGQRDSLDRQGHHGKFPAKSSGVAVADTALEQPALAGQPGRGPNAAWVARDAAGPPSTSAVAAEAQV